MAYAVIDRREWKVVEMSSAKKNLTAKGLVVDVDHLDRCPPTELVAAYRGLVGNRGIRRPTKAVMAKLAEVIKEAGKAVAKDSPEGEGPVAKVHHLCDELKDKPRKEVIATCVAKGINPHTARTQYQRWYATHRH